MVRGVFLLVTTPSVFVHRGPLRLYHGSRWPSGLYHHGFLSALARRAPDLAYHACVSGDEIPTGFRGQRAERFRRDHGHSGA